MGIYIYIDIIIICHTLMCWLFLSNCSCISICSMNFLFLFATEATVCSEADDNGATNWSCC